MPLIISAASLGWFGIDREHFRQNNPAPQKLRSKRAQLPTAVFLPEMACPMPMEPWNLLPNGWGTDDLRSLAASLAGAVGRFPHFDEFVPTIQLYQHSKLFFPTVDIICTCHLSCNLATSTLSLFCLRLNSSSHRLRVLPILDLYLFYNSLQTRTISKCLKNWLSKTLVVTAPRRIFMWSSTTRSTTPHLL